MMNQRQATVSAIVSVLAERGYHYEFNGETPVSEVLTRADIEKVRATLCAGFNVGKIEMSNEGRAKYINKPELKNYVSGLVNNWIRKAPEFNGGNAYQAKNPGSRAGAGDEQLKEMKKLLSVTTDERAKSLIQKAIDARTAEIKAESNQVEIDISKLPEELRKTLGL